MKSKFDGRLGIWPFVYERVVQRQREGGPQRGSIVTEAITGVKRELYSKFLLEKVLPAIKEKMPRANSRKIIIQQDNSPVHIRQDNAVFRQAT